MFDPIFCCNPVNLVILSKKKKGVFDEKTLVTLLDVLYGSCLVFFHQCFG